MSKPPQKKIRTFSQFLLSLRNTIWRMLIYFEILGWKLPGRRRARAELGDQTVAYFDRKRILRELRSARFRTQFGPLWFRPLNDSIVSFWEQNRFWAKVFFKLLAGVFFVAVPFSIFTLIRGILPVPGRVPTIFQPKSPNNSAGFFGSYQPYFAEDGRTQNLVTGSLPRKMLRTEGFLISQQKPLRLVANQAFRPSVSGRSFIRFDVESGSGSNDANPESCELLVQDDHGQEIFRGSFETEQTRGRIASEARRIFESRFTPQFDSLEKNWIPVILDTNRFPNQLVFKANNSGVLPDEKKCEFLVTSPYFQMEQTHSRKGNGLLLVVAEGLGTSDKIPEEWEGDAFKNHHVLHSERKASLQDILEFDSIHKTLPQNFAANGYATFYGGELFDEQLNAKGFQTAVGLETGEYNARHTTEEFAKWLSELGGAGFFATLKYDLLTPPYRPPFAEVDLWTLFKNPFGLKRERSLRKSSSQFLNAELMKLRNHIVEQDRWNSSDVILTSSAPIHLRERIWNSDNLGKTNTLSAARRFASTTWEVDTRVPLHWKTAEQNDPLPKIEHSNHLDLPQLIKAQFDLTTDLIPWKFIEKKSIPLVGEDEIAILDFGIGKKAIKYVFPFRPRKIDVATGGFPFRETKVLAPEERLTLVDAAENAVDLAESPTNLSNSNQLGLLRRSLMDSQFPKGTPIKFESESVDLYIEQEFGSLKADALSWTELPNGIGIASVPGSESEPFRWVIKGTLSAGNSLKIFWKENDLKILHSNIEWAAICGGAWKISWQTLLDLSAKIHPCLFQEDRIRELSGFRDFGFPAQNSVKVSFFHNSASRFANRKEN